MTIEDMWFNVVVECLRRGQGGDAAADNADAVVDAYKAKFVADGVITTSP